MNNLPRKYLKWEYARFLERQNTWCDITGGMVSVYLGRLISERVDVLISAGSCRRFFFFVQNMPLMIAAKVWLEPPGL